MKEIQNRLATAVVYLVHASGLNFGKVGKANDLKKRLMGIQVGCPVKCVAAAVIPCVSGYEAERIEKAIHGHLFWALDEYEHCPIRSAEGDWYEGFQELEAMFLSLPTARRCEGAALVRPAPANWRAVFRQGAPPATHNSNGVSEADRIARPPLDIHLADLKQTITVIQRQERPQPDPMPTEAP